MPENLIEKLPDKIKAQLPEEKKIELCLKGKFKEWLVCMPTKLYILKTGMVTGHTFGIGIFQMPYRNITGVKVEYQFATGYFEVSAAGFETKPRKWGDSSPDSPQEAQNCVSIGGDKMMEQFRAACDFINDKIAALDAPVVAPASAHAPSVADEIKKFKELLDSGAITQGEYDAKKKQLLGL